MKTIRKFMAALTISGAALVAAACGDSPVGGTGAESMIVPRFDGGGGFGSGNRLGSDSTNVSGRTSSTDNNAAGDSTTITGGGGGFGSGN